MNPLEAARAAYLWRLHAERAAIGAQLADLDIVFRSLLLLQDGEESAALLRARSNYVVELHAAHPDLEGKIDHLAALHQDLTIEALD